MLRYQHRRGEQEPALEVEVVHLTEPQIQVVVEVVEEHWGHQSQEPVVVEAEVLKVLHSLVMVEVEEQNQRRQELAERLEPESLVCYPLRTKV